MMIEQGKSGWRQGWRCCAFILSISLLTSCESFQYYHGAGTFHTVILDAGHGGYDVGGRPAYGIYEKDINLDIVQRLAPILRNKGYHVVLTRNSDSFIPLATRIAISNNTPNSIFISVHTNWSRNRYARGLETYYYVPNSRRLAANILRELNTVSLTSIRGVKFAKYYVLRHNLQPAVLCEVGFDSNRAENSLLQNARHRQSLAEAIAQGIVCEAQGRLP